MSKIDEYQLFEQVEQLMKMVEQPRPVRCPKTGQECQSTQYLKLVQTSGLAEVHHDYGRGFLVVLISTTRSHEQVGALCTWLWFATLDDGDYGAWGKPFKDLDKALEHTRQVAEVFRDMVTLPDEQQLNELLRPLGMWAGRE